MANQKKASDSYLNKSLKFDESKSKQFIYFDVDLVSPKGNVPLSLKDERKKEWENILDARVIETSSYFYKCIITIPWTKFVAWVPAFLVSGVDD